MELLRAQCIAEAVVALLKPFCERIEVGGSIRRRRPFVHDIDLVAIPSNQGQFVTKLMAMGRMKMGGQKVIRVTMAEIELDVYVATPVTWATLLLIRTGSARHNVMLCSRAKSMGMKLHADGSGLFSISADCETIHESRIAGDTEESIFNALRLPYKRPEERE
jgi:DNA polymerase (family 10)